MDDRQVVDGPTVRAVVAYAADLRRAAELKMQADVYARPYYPTTASAQKLSQRLGPGGALLRLRELALQHERRDAERDAASSTSLVLLTQRRVRDDRRTARQLEKLTYGQRIDRALNELKAISSVPAAPLGGDLVHGGEADRTPRFVGDPSGPARRLALRAVEAVERELEHAKRRDLKAAA